MKQNLSKKPFLEYLTAFKHAQHHQLVQNSQQSAANDATATNVIDPLSNSIDDFTNNKKSTANDPSSPINQSAANDPSSPINQSAANDPSSPINQSAANDPSGTKDINLPSLDSYRFASPTTKLSQLSRIYAELLYIPTLFDVKPQRCSQQNDDNNCCYFQRKNIFTWQQPVITFRGLYKLSCYHQYCLTHHKFVERQLLLQLSLQQLRVSVYQTGQLLTGFGVHLLLRSVYLLQTNMSLVLNVANAFLLAMIHDRINAWKVNADVEKVSLLKQILTETTDDESAKALQSILLKRGKITTFCEEISEQINELAMKLFDDSLITDCKIIENKVLCQINFDATFDAGENITNRGKSLRSVVANFCTNKGKVSNPPILAQSENTRLFVAILSQMFNKVFEHYGKKYKEFVFLLVLDDTKSYVNLPMHISTALINNPVVDFNDVEYQIFLAEDRMHRVGRWLKAMPKSMHQYNFFLKCISSHHARTEKGSIKLSSGTKMNVDEYYNRFFFVKWRDKVNDAKNDLCQLITCLVQIEDTKFVYTKKLYKCNLKCRRLFVHCLKHLGELASYFLARYILFEPFLLPPTRNVKIELVTAKDEHWEVPWCALPTFIFKKLTEKCGYPKLSIGCWQTSHLFLGFDEYLSNWSM